jgi:hypothetical protein
MFNVLSGSALPTGKQMLRPGMSKRRRPYMAELLGATARRRRLPSEFIDEFAVRLADTGA